MKLIIFDCDGTIADSQNIISAAMGRAFASHDLAPPDRPDLLGVVGLSLDHAITQLLPPTPSPDPDLVKALSNSYRQAFQILRTDPAHTEPLFAHAREVIDSLSKRQDLVLGIATGKSRRGVDALLERENLDHYFSTIQTADDHPSKPHPSMIQTAMVEAGAASQNTVMIGDTTFDIDMARAANAGAIGVTWGYHPGRELRQAGAHALAESFSELEDTIDAVLATHSETAV